MEDESYGVIVTAPFWPEADAFDIEAGEVGTYQHIFYEEEVKGVKE